MNLAELLFVTGNFDESLRSAEDYQRSAGGELGPTFKLIVSFFQNINKYAKDGDEKALQNFQKDLADLGPKSKLQVNYSSDPLTQYVKEGLKPIDEGRRAAVKKAIADLAGTR